jgi:hypothetical protein
VLKASEKNYRVVRVCVVLFYFFVVECICNFYGGRGGGKIAKHGTKKEIKVHI